MPKRKLGSHSVSTKTRKQPIQHEKNPFLFPRSSRSGSTPDGVEFDDDELLVRTVAFLDLGKSISFQNENDGTVRMILFESLRYLLIFLENEAPNDSNWDQKGRRTEAATRTSTIILPWVTRRLVEVLSPGYVVSQEDSILWRALAAALASLSPPDADVKESHHEMKQNVPSADKQDTFEACSARC